jgi:signal peptidase II
VNARNLGLAGVIGGLFADQASKLVMLYGFGFAHLAPGARIPVLPFLSLVMAWNRGVSFSLFAAQSPIGVAVLAVFEVVVIGGLAVWMWRGERPVLSAGLGLIIGGALGNLVDRLVYGRVADFFDIHAFGHDFFACNMGDVAITLGVILMVADTMIDGAAQARNRGLEDAQ